MIVQLDNADHLFLLEGAWSKVLIRPGTGERSYALFFGLIDENGRNGPAAVFYSSGNTYIGTYQRNYLHVSICNT